MRPTASIAECAALFAETNDAWLYVRSDKGSIALRLSARAVAAAIARGRGDEPVAHLVSGQSQEMMRPSRRGLTPSSDAVRTPSHLVWLPPDGVLRIVVQQGADVSLQDIQETFAAAASLIARNDGGGIIVDLRGLRSLDREVRDYLRSRDGGVGVGLIVHSPLSRWIANFFMGLRRGPNTPVRMFPDEASAAAWLRDLRAQRGARSDTA